MHTLQLAPTDVLFFRDGRPMGGSLAGHSAAWPLPSVTNAALHAALWRAGFAEKVHPHRRARSGQILSENREQHGERFGSLVTAGPFPVCTKGPASTWFFPRPLDAISDELEEKYPSTRITFKPVAPTAGATSSLAAHSLPLAVVSVIPPDKKKAKGWWSEGAWNTYLGSSQRDELAQRAFFKNDTDFADTEAQIGIGIDPESGTQDGKSLYSAYYLRLRDGWQLGLFAQAEDKDFPDYRNSAGRGDLLKSLFASDTEHIVIGGQQRVCTAKLTNSSAARLPMPLGCNGGFSTAIIAGREQHLVKWVLLSPAIYPQIAADPTRNITAHPGGWLPNWISVTEHRVLLKGGNTERRDDEGRERWRERVRRDCPPIAATLVAAIVSKPVTVTGWALGDERLGDEAKAGAKPTHLAVPAGSVYYFACDTADDAIALAAALNWHGGDTAGTTIRNRRSTLLGEKGFGLGVCGTWQFHA